MDIPLQPSPGFILAYVQLPIGGVGSQSNTQQRPRVQNSGPSPGLGHPYAQAHFGNTGPSVPGSGLGPQPWHIPHLRQIPNYQPQLQLQQQHGPIPTQGVYNLQHQNPSAAINHVQLLPAMHQPHTHTLFPRQPALQFISSAAADEYPPLYGNHVPNQLPVQPQMIPAAVSGVSLGMGGSSHQVSHHLVDNPAPPQNHHSYSQREYPISIPTAEMAAGRATVSRKRTRKREPRDPRKPKKPCSPFIFFGNTSRHLIREGSIKKARGENMKALAEIWRIMSAEEKKPHVAAYEVDQKRYLREMKEYELKFGKGKRHAVQASSSSEEDSTADSLHSLPPALPEHRQ